MTTCSLSKFTDAYIMAALWSSYGDDDTPLDEKYDRSDIHEATLARMRKDCETFFVGNEESILCEGGPTGKDGSSQVEMAGHDFWLTRCGHGAGFWDGDWPEPHAGKLTREAELFGNVDLYIGDDGKIHGI